MDSGIIEIVKQHLMDQVGLPPEKLSTFIRDASAQLNKVMDELDEAIDEGLFDTVVSSSHRLKGSLLNLGLEELSMVAGNIETAADSTSPLYLSCYFMRLRRDLKPLLDCAKEPSS